MRKKKEKATFLECFVIIVTGTVLIAGIVFSAISCSMAYRKEIRQSEEFATNA